jgi:phytoene synthase
MINAAGHYCLELLQDRNSPSYTSLLFLPEKIRGHAAALYAFHEEIERIAFVVHEAMPGEIRLQWWRDVIAGERTGEAAANPLSAALIETITKHQLPRDGFARYLDARIFDLYNDPMPDTGTMEAYFGETESFILQMVANCNGCENTTLLANACGHGGVVVGIAKLISRLAFDRDRQRVFIPVNLLAEYDLEPRTWLADSNPGHAAALMHLTRKCAEHFAKFQAAVRQAGKEQRAVFLSVAISAELARKTGTQLNRTNKVDWHHSQRLAPLAIQWILWKTALTGY